MMSRCTQPAYFTALQTLYKLYARFTDRPACDGSVSLRLSLQGRGLQPNLIPCHLHAFHKAEEGLKSADIHEHAQPFQEEPYGLSEATRGLQISLDTPPIPFLRSVRMAGAANSALRRTRTYVTQKAAY